MENTLRYWMWGYQHLFVHRLQYEAAEVLAAIGLGKVATRGLVVGILSPGKTDPNPVCLSPEEGLSNLDEWHGLPALVEDTLRNHPEQMMVYGDAPSMADKPETLFRDSVRMAVHDFVAPGFASEGMATFVGTAAPVGKYHVAPVVGVDEAILDSEFVLAEAVRFDKWSSARILAHAAPEELLSEATHSRRFSMVSFRKLGRVVVVTAAIPTAALAAKLTALGGNVRLTTDETAVEGCEALGDVVAKPPFVLPDDWQVKLRNAGGDIGATIVWHNKPSIGQVAGKAYRCTAPDTASEPAGSSCGKDTDCKGDRICEEGSCKAPSK